ncbi:patatin-like phospholipase domain-containing protein 6 [Tubulanus polymorphus]|uniref:patatin-like phospholipase domain-containing protein 6 n=1 Tax=Tubulanus polymorphus TaxID=672921 RepID=UPI003DA64B1D
MAAKGFYPGVAADMPEFVEKVKEKVHEVTETLSSYDLTVNIVTGLVVGIVTALIILFISLRKLKAKVMPSSQPDEIKPRFRKRDKVLFYGRKMLRKVRSFTKNTAVTLTRVESAGKSIRPKKRQLVVKFAKRLLRMRRESIPQLQVKEPPQSFLEMEATQQPEIRLPAEVMYMLKSVRVFGHFEKPLFLELCRFVESKFIPAGSLMFRVGEPDDSIFVVQSGKINVFITEADGTESIIKEVSTGDSIHSLLSILDVITGHPAPYKTVSAVAHVDSHVLRLPAHAFSKIFDNYAESMVRVVQVIMVRLQRVTFMALHNYLGLSNELINHSCQPEKRMSVQSLSGNPLVKYAGQQPPQRTVSSTSAEEKVLNIVTGSYDDDVAESSRTKPLRRGSEIPAENSSHMKYLQRLELRRFSDSSTLIARGSRPSGIDEHDLESVPSDFDVALSQARVNQQSRDDPLSIGTPPAKSTMEELHFQYKRQSSKRSNIAEEPEAHVIDDQHMLNMARDDLILLLGLKDPSQLDNKLMLRHFRAGTTLTKQGDQDASLLFVVTGTLQCMQHLIDIQGEACLFITQAGELVGGLAVLTGEPQFFGVRAKTDATVVLITKKDFYTLMYVQPSIVKNVAHSVVRRMSPFVRQIDFALDWNQIEAGRPLYRQGEQSDCVYIILNGRLRNVITLNDGKKELVGEYGRGELIGIVEVLTQTERATTVLAVRDTDLAKLPAELLNVIKRRYPKVVTRLIHLLGQRILGSLQSPQQQTSKALLEHPNVDQRSTVANLATVAVVAASEDVPVSNFTLELQYSLNAIGPTLRLTSEIIQKRLGPSALESVNEYRLTSWLGQQEDLHRMVLYQCDTRVTPWTKQCIRQADCILVVGIAENDPVVSPLEKQLENLSVRAQKELVLLHREDVDKPRPGGTVHWLNARGWCSSHHHIRCPKRVFSGRSPEKMMDLYKKLFDMEPDRLSDFSRLARFLTGTSIGLVLGGGGARGIAHVGMIRSLNEAGIPIDIVGGTSIGSFMGALYAEERNLTRFTQRAREWSMIMGSLWKKVLDLTYPVTSMFTGRSFNQSIEEVFRDRQIEDLWIPYFCITTDITTSKMKVHTSGSLWRYVRSSMSLAGYLPPLCDPVDGSLLLDGGYVNNLPADIMRSMGAQTIFAVDVGSLDDTNLTNYGDDLSGWWLLWKRWNPWASPVRVPDMQEIQSRLAYVSCVRQLEAVKDSDYCEYIRPPIDRYKTLQFGAFDEIHDVGFNHGKTLFSAWAKSDMIKQLFKEKKVADSIKKTASPKTHLMTADTGFTDLAELVSRIDRPKFYIASDNEEDEYDGDEEVQSEPEMEIDHGGDDYPDVHRPMSEGEERSSDDDNIIEEEGEYTYDDYDDALFRRHVSGNISS